MQRSKVIRIFNKYNTNNNGYKGHISVYSTIVNIVNRSGAISGEIMTKNRKAFLELENKPLELNTNTGSSSLL